MWQVKAEKVGAHSGCIEKQDGYSANISTQAVARRGSCGLLTGERTKRWDTEQLQHQHDRDRRWKVLFDLKHCS